MSEKFFYFHNTPEDLKVSSAGFNFVGEAGRWLRHQRAERLINTWAELCKLVIHRFDSEGKRVGHLSAFARIQQTSTVKKYIQAFEDLSNRVHGFSVQFKVETFLSGLREDIKNEVTPFKPTNMLDIKEMALMQEIKLVDAKKSTYRTGRTSDTAANSRRPPPPGVKQLTSEEQARRREAGLCFNCDEKHFRGHACKHPAKVLCLEAILEEESLPKQPDTENPQPVQVAEIEENQDVTLLTIVGEASPRTIHIQVSEWDTTPNTGKFGG